MQEMLQTGDVSILSSEACVLRSAQWAYEHATSATISSAQTVSSRFTDLRKYYYNNL